jgi:hypothetical protein
MIENVVPITPPPGLYRNGTKYQAAGRWYDGNLIRWLEGILRPVGGRQPVQWSQSGTTVQDSSFFASSTPFNDTFTGGAANISGHAPDTGTAWGAGSDIKLTGSGTLKLNAGDTLFQLLNSQTVQFGVGWSVWAEFTVPNADNFSGNVSVMICSNAGKTEYIRLLFDSGELARTINGQMQLNYGSGGDFLISGSAITLTNGLAAGTYRVVISALASNSLKLELQPGGGGSALYSVTATGTAAWNGYLDSASHNRFGLWGSVPGGADTCKDQLTRLQLNPPPSVGPSTTYQNIILTGNPRGSVAWRTNAGLAFMGIGTTSDAYKYSNGVATSLVPFRANGRTTANSWADTSFGAPRVNGVFQTGNYGRGAYGRGRYGRGTGALTLVEADTWTLDNFGETLVGCYTLSNEVYYETAGAFQLITGAPSGKAIVCTPEQFIFVLGAAGDGRHVQWCDQGDKTTWTPTATNQAGGFYLTTRGTLRAGMRTRRQTLLWTDVDLHAATYVGGDFIYQFEQLGDNCGIISPHGAAVVGDVAFWMSYNRFFKYDGGLYPLRCDVLDYVFGDFQKQNQAKVFAVTLTQFNEVWWFYPSASQAGTECDRYVVYNYHDDIWYFGQMARGTGVDRGIFEYALWMHSSSGVLYEQEKLQVRDASAYVESGPLEVDSGNVLTRIQRIIPDEKNQGDVQARIYAAYYPNGTEREYGPYSSTNPTPVRLTARQLRLRFEEVKAVDWRIGTMRIGIVPAGRR